MAEKILKNPIAKKEISLLIEYVNQLQMECVDSKKDAISTVFNNISSDLRIFLGEGKRSLLAEDDLQKMISENLHFNRGSLNNYVRDSVRDYFFKEKQKFDIKYDDVQETDTALKENRQVPENRKEIAEKIIEFRKTMLDEIYGVFSKFLGSKEIG